MSHHRRSPRPLSEAIANGRRQWQPDTALGRAQSAWEEIGRVWGAALGSRGAYILDRTSLVSLRAGVLTVSCSESVVADTLELESATLIARLNEQLEGDPVTRLRCVSRG